MAIRKALLTATLFLASYVSNAATLLTEGFDDVSTLAGNGWTIVNNSTPGGSTSWFQGNTGVFDALTGAPNSYVASNFLSTGFGGDISVWLISPLLDLSDSTILSFATRGAAEGFADNLEVRFSTAGASADVGGTTTSVGDFSNLLAVLNPALDPYGYPADWTTYSLNFSGAGSGVMGRFAFRYYVTDTFNNGDYIGIDNVNVSVPEPSTWALFGLGFFALLWTSRRQLQARVAPRF